MYFSISTSTNKPDVNHNSNKKSDQAPKLTASKTY